MKERVDTPWIGVKKRVDTSRIGVKKRRGVAVADRRESETRSAVK